MATASGPGDQERADRADQRADEEVPGAVVVRDGVPRLVGDEPEPVLRDRRARQLRRPSRRCRRAARRRAPLPRGSAHGARDRRGARADAGSSSPGPARSGVRGWWGRVPWYGAAVGARRVCAPGPDRGPGASCRSSRSSPCRRSRILLGQRREGELRAERLARRDRVGQERLEQVGLRRLLTARARR